ncbi:hypothetical protein RF55_4061 [Lasius niger]|uniref:ER membrane protein complex subunit 7 beta-sandwich domain-containing protein n=1 Tax=Lasius niger TaxID=67767 RepID=A0A0J7KZH0_LASNI|nr:hypothetical protein RF55_4061 [Lasius niger]
MKKILYLLFIFANLREQYVIAEHEEDSSTDLYVIEGKVFPWDNAASSGWQLMTHVMANGGEHYGFLREDGTFIISNVPSGSYMVEVVLMMVLPLVLIMILPKIMNDPETRKEMEQLNNLTIYNMPEMSEVITSFLSGGEKQKSKAVKAAKKRQ